MAAFPILFPLKTRPFQSEFTVDIEGEIACGSRKAKVVSPQFDAEAHVAAEHEATFAKGDTGES